MNFSASFAFCHKPLSITFSIFTLPPATTSAKKLVVIWMLYCSRSCHSSHLLHPVPGLEPFPWAALAWCISSTAQGPCGGTGTPKADFMTEQLVCSSLRCRAGACLQDWAYQVLLEDSLHSIGVLNTCRRGAVNHFYHSTYVAEATKLGWTLSRPSPGFSQGTTV